MHLEISVSKILAHMVLQNYQNVIEMTSNMIYVVAFGVVLKCPRKIHMNTKLVLPPPLTDLPTALSCILFKH